MQGLKTRRLLLPRNWARGPTRRKGLWVCNSSIQQLSVNLL